MVEEARFEETEQGKFVTNDGWFTLHVSEAPWMATERFGKGCRFEGMTRFPDVGVNLRIIEPGQPACLYHREEAQEDFFVMAGECLLVVEEQERHLKAGHFVHCPPGTNHVFVGAGDERCVILMIGHHPETEAICYPVSGVAAKHGASVETETLDPRDAYGEIQREPTDPIWPLYGVD